jgi:peptide/nickel transport system ATP-binding protein
MNSDGTAGSAQELLRVQGLRIEARLGVRRTIVSDLDLELAAGEAVAIVGESGSGKSMTARALIGLLPRGLFAAGDVRYLGNDVLGLPEKELARLRGRELGLILQDPFTMLNPLLRCGPQITEGLRTEQHKKLDRRAVRAEAIRRLSEVGIDDPGVADQFPFQLSGGMRQRVGLAAALARDPKILIADEPTTALDVTTQKEILGLLKSVQERRGMGMILITHDLRVAFSLCHRVYVLYAGALLETGPALGLEDEPLHPYTLGLLLSEPPADRRIRELITIAGAVPAAGEVEERCAFSSRCRWAQPVCIAEKPALRPVAPGRHSACVRIGEIRAELVSVRKATSAPAPSIASRTSETPLVRVESLGKVFQTRARRQRLVQALADVSLEIGAGESVGLVGESGSGKTTLARCLLGLEKPDTGSIVVDGIQAADYEALTARDRRRLRRTIQMVFQDPYSTLNPSLTVESTLREALSEGDRRERGLEVAALLGRVGLPLHYAKRKPVALSGGERQRVAIARALAVRPKVIVCDEPVSALDVSVQAQILNLLKSIRDELGTSYLFITHDLAVARQVVERIYVLYRGNVVESGFVDDVLDNPQHAYTAQLVDSVPRPQAAWLASGAN